MEEEKEKKNKRKKEEEEKKKKTLLIIQAFWDTASSRLLNSYRRFERPDWLCVQDQAVPE